MNMNPLSMVIIKTSTTGIVIEMLGNIIETLGNIIEMLQIRWQAL